MTKTELRFILGAISLTLILGFVYIDQIKADKFFSNPPQGTDMYTYHICAKNIVDGKGFAKNINYTPPLYCFVFLPLAYLIFGVNPFAVYAIQVIIGALCVFITYLIAKKLFNARIAIISAYIHSLYGVFIIYYGALLAETVINLMYLMAMWSLLIVLERDGLKYRILCGILFGLAILAKPTMMGFIPFLSIPLFVKRGIRLKAVTDFFTIVVLIAVTILPLTIRNYVISGKFIPVSSNAIDIFLIGNNPDSTGSYTPASRFMKNISKEISAIEPDSKNSFIIKKIFSFIKENPAKFSGIMWKKFCLFWGKWDIPDNLNYYYNSYINNQKIRPQVLDFKFLISWEILVALGITGMFFSAKKWKELITLYLFVFIYSFIVIMFFVVGRYRLPVFPILAVFSAFTISYLVSMFKNRRYNNVLGVFLVFGILFCVESGYAQVIFSPAGIYEKKDNCLLVRDTSDRLFYWQYLGRERDKAKKQFILNFNPEKYKRAEIYLYVRFLDQQGFLNIIVNNKENARVLPQPQQGSNKYAFYIVEVSPSNFLKGVNVILMQPSGGARVYLPIDASYKYGHSSTICIADDYEEKNDGEFMVKLNFLN